MSTSHVVLKTNLYTNNLEDFNDRENDKTLINYKYIINLTFNKI